MRLDPHIRKTIRWGGQRGEAAGPWTFPMQLEAGVGVGGGGGLPLCAWPRRDESSKWQSSK
jgi:hypothetical protein